MGDTPRKSYKDIIGASATDELAGGPPAVAKDGAGKEGGGPENGTTTATPEEIVSRAPPRAHFFYAMANTAESDKPMTGDERCKGFEQFQSMLQPGIFGEKIGPVENAEISFATGKPKYLGRSAVGLVEFTANVDNVRPAADGGGTAGGGAARCLELERAIQKPGAVEQSRSFLLKTEFDIESFDTFVLLDKCMNVGNLAADMIDFATLVYGGLEDLWMAYIPDSGEFVVAGGDEFRGKSVFLINWGIDRVMNMIDDAAKKSVSVPFWLIDFTDPVTKEREIHISDRGVYLGLHGLSPALQRTYGERIDSTVVKLVAVTGNLMKAKIIYVSSEGHDSAGDYRKGTKGGAALEAVFAQAGLAMGKVRQAKPGGFDLRNTGVVALLVPVSANAQYQFEWALTKWDTAAGDPMKGGFCVTNEFDGTKSEIRDLAQAS
jgi:hypothetical protein